MEKLHLATIDVGTSKICTLIAQVESENAVKILGVGIEPSQGVRKGMVYDIQQATAAISKSIRKAERTSGFQISDAIISIAGSHINAINNKATVSIVGGCIDEYEIRRVIDSVKAVPIPNNRTILHTMQRTYSVDGIEGIRSPLGMYGRRLDVEAHIITGATATVENLKQCILANEIEVNSFVLNSLAAGEVVLSDIEKQSGVFVCDLGAGTADLAIYFNNDVWHTNSLPIGGAHITNDIAQIFHLSYNQAEEVKKIHGSALPELIDDEEFFYARSFGQEESAKYSRKELASVISVRVEEIFQLIRQDIKRSGIDHILPAGMVLTGGCALLPGIERVASNVLGLPVRVAKPENLTGMIDQLDSPAFSASVGLLYWRMKTEVIEDPQSRKADPGEALSKVRRFIRMLFP